MLIIEVAIWLESHAQSKLGLKTRFWLSVIPGDFLKIYVQKQ